MNRLIGTLAACGLAVGCGAPEPNVVVTTTPSKGVAPVAVTFDATGSNDPDDPRATLTARFDFDGDGTFETGPLTELAADFVYEVAGTYKPIVEITSGERIGTAQLQIEVQPNTAPTGVVTVTPTNGRAPHAVTVDASGVTDPNEDAATLAVRFDFESDGTFDTEFSTTKTTNHVFQRSGEFRVTVEVQDHAGATGTATSEPITVEAGADIDVDTNRDGIIDDADDEAEDVWTLDSGATFLANFDDDDFDGQRDADDAQLEGGEDLKDFARVIVHQNAELTAQDQVSVTVTPPAAADAVRIFLTTSGGTIRTLHEPGDSGARSIDPTDLAGDVTLLLEGTETRSSAWDGTVTLTLSMSSGGETLTDAVALRVSPVIFTDNMQPAERLYVMRIDDRRLGPNLEFYTALQRDIPTHVELYTADQYEYLGDRWLQDNMQTGYQSMASEGGQAVMKTHLQTQRPTGPRGLEPFLISEALGADRGWAYPGRSRDTSLNYGGNLEVAPPHDGYPLGRVIIGGGEGGTLDGRAYSDTMGELQRAWLDAQEIQGPSIEVASEWLAVGHIDEIFLFVPNRNAGAGERPWKVLFASPDLAVEILETIADDGAGNTQVFAGRQTQTTVSQILGNTRLMGYQDSAQAKIDSIREVLTTSLQLTPDDIIEVPVLYEWHPFDGLNFAAAYNPGIQNLIVLDDFLFVPDPEGPVVGGLDAFQTATRQVLEPMGLTVQFVDIFDSYHLNLGEAHCGTEVEGTAYETPWWNQ